MSKEINQPNEQANRCSSACSTVAALIEDAKADIERSFKEANDAHKSGANQSFHEGQHHAYKYAYLVLESLERKVIQAIQISDLDQ